MNLTEKSADVARGMFDVLGLSPDHEQARKVTEIVEKAIINAVLETKSQCLDVAVECCAPDKKLVHKISTEERLAVQALITNLSSLR